VNIDRQMAQRFVDRYKQVWEDWDVDGWVDLFSDDAVYYEHPTDETLVGSEQLAEYLRKEHSEEGQASVRMGEPIVDGDKLVVEFWATMIRDDGERATLTGCMIARLDPSDGRCVHYRQYWFELDGHVAPFDGWGE
jgi:ketosteroid isomerase-like protein